LLTWLEWLCWLREVGSSQAVTWSPVQRHSSFRRPGRGFGFPLHFRPSKRHT
jgi:hypothetical protein